MAQIALEILCFLIPNEYLPFLAFFYIKRYNKNMKKLMVNQKYDGKKLNKFLLENIPNLSSNLFYKTLRKKDIKINNKRICKNVILHENDEIVVYISDNLLTFSIDITIFYEDENILILNKPVNLEVTGKNSLTTYVHQKYPNATFKPMPCHRIDRNTIGLVLFAKNEETLSILLDKFKKHEIEKHYLALVNGIPNDNDKRCEAYLLKDSKNCYVSIFNVYKRNAQKVITTYHVLEKRIHNQTSLLDVEIETGKTHQIRAHLAYLGYPIIGDGKYGNYEINKKFGKKYQMLCSYILKFNFKSNSGCLDYLSGKNFVLEEAFNIF